MVGATMNTDKLLRRVRAIPGVLVASIMHGCQSDRLYVKVAAGDTNEVLRSKATPATIGMATRLAQSTRAPGGASVLPIRRAAPGGARRAVPVFCRAGPPPGGAPGRRAVPVFCWNDGV